MTRGGPSLRGTLFSTKQSSIVVGYLWIASTKIRPRNDEERMIDLLKTMT